MSQKVVPEDSVFKEPKPSSGAPPGGGRVHRGPGSGRHRGRTEARAAAEAASLGVSLTFLLSTLVATSRVASRGLSLLVTARQASSLPHVSREQVTLVPAMELGRPWGPSALGLQVYHGDLQSITPYVRACATSIQTALRGGDSFHLKVRRLRPGQTKVFAMLAFPLPPPADPLVPVPISSRVTGQSPRPSVLQVMRCFTFHEGRENIIPV